MHLEIPVQEQMVTTGNFDIVLVLRCMPVLRFGIIQIQIVVVAADCN